MVSVVICTHNPRPDVFGMCVDALRAQVAAGVDWEIVVVDNASDRRPVGDLLPGGVLPVPVRVVREPLVGLKYARKRGLSEAMGDVIVFVDDDNLLDSSYIFEVHRFFRGRPSAGIVGGRLTGVYEGQPPEWIGFVADSLAVRDLGDGERLAAGVPIYGAGMAIRRQCLDEVLRVPLFLTGRRGGTMLSGEDVEMSHRARRLGWEVWYAGILNLQHFIEARRLTLSYHQRLRYGIGMAMPVLECYADSSVVGRRWLSLRRALAMSARHGIRLGPLDSAGQDSVEETLEEARLRGMSRGLWCLALGAPIWKVIEEEFPSTGPDGVRSGARV